MLRIQKDCIVGILPGEDVSGCILLQGTIIQPEKQTVGVMVLHGGTVPGGTACEGTAGGGTVGNSAAQSEGLRGTVR